MIIYTLIIMNYINLKDVINVNSIIENKLEIIVIANIVVITINNF